MTSITVTVPGTGYTTPPTVTIGGTGGATATASVRRESTPAGGVSNVIITTPGSGYTAPTVTFSAPSNPQGITATGTVQMTGGAITGVTITNPGGGYTAPPTATINDPTGLGAMTSTTVNSFFPTFVDNYYSNQGVGASFDNYTGLQGVGPAGSSNSLSTVVDVELHPEDLYGKLGLGLTGTALAGAEEFDTPQSALPGGLSTVVGSHSYPVGWYAQASIQNPNSPANQLNGLYWSPLLYPSTTASLIRSSGTSTSSFYAQQQQSTARART